MKKLISTALIFFLLFCTCSCSSAVEPDSTLSQLEQTQATHVNTPGYYGTWHVCGLSTFSNDPSNMAISVTDSNITLEAYGETMGPFEYTESYNSAYTYLEIKDDSMPFVLVLINEEMMGLFLPTSEAGTSRYTGETPWKTEFNAEIEILSSVFMKDGAGTTSLPSYLDLDKLATDEFADYTEYVYYSKAHILQIDGFGLGCFYIHEGGGADYIERLTLANLDPSDYDESDIFTDSNFVITDTK